MRRRGEVMRRGGFRVRVRGFEGMKREDEGGQGGMPLPNWKNGSRCRFIGGAILSGMYVVL
jgi:hypothetical protein